jgi:hypothetical protein
MKKLLCFFWIACCCLAGVPACAQSSPDTALHRNVTLAPQNATDSLPRKPQPFQPIPKKSALYSAILPGAGQLYNRQCWKIPVIYAGVGVATYFIVENSRQYQRYRAGYIARITNPNVQDDFTNKYSQQDLQVLQSTYRKYLDMTLLFTGIGYTLQVMDALAFAHLKNFDVSKDISMRFQPVALPNGDPGLGIVMRF